MTNVLRGISADDQEPIRNVEAKAIVSGNAEPAPAVKSLLMCRVAFARWRALQREVLSSSS